MSINQISTKVSGDGSDPVENKLLRRNEKLALAASKRQLAGTVGYREYNQIVGTHSAWVAGQLSNKVSGTNASQIGHPWSRA